MKDNWHHWLLLSCLALLLFVSACRPSTSTVEPTVPSDLEDLEAALTAEVVDDRPEVVDYLGRPDAFTILLLRKRPHIARGRPAGRISLRMPSAYQFFSNSPSL